MKKQKLFRADGEIGRMDEYVEGNTGLKPVDMYIPPKEDAAMGAEGAFALGRMIGTPELRPGFRIGSHYWRLDDVLAVVITVSILVMTVHRLRHWNG